MQVKLSMIADLRTVDWRNEDEVILLAVKVEEDWV